MHVFGFLPLKKMFRREMERNYTWFSAATGQILEQLC